LGAGLVEDHILISSGGVPTPTWDLGCAPQDASNPQQQFYLDESHMPFSAFVDICEYLFLQVECFFG